MKFSMMTYTLMRQKVYTVQDCVRVAKELEMDGIDWVTTYGEDPAELKKMSDDAGLPVAAHTFFLRSAEGVDLRAVAERSLDDAVTLGAPLVMIPPMPVAGITDPAENRKHWAGILNMVMPMAADRGLTVTVENFPGMASPVVTADDFYALQKEVPGLKLTFDNGNAASGEDQIGSLKRCFKDVAHVHFKDWICRDTPEEKWRQMRDGKYYRAALIGEGVVDSRSTLGALEELGYSGFINIEYESNDYPAHEAMKKVLEYLRK